MEPGQKTYDKANSIIEIHGSVGQPVSLAERLATVRSTLTAQRTGSYFDSIVLRACNDALDAGPQTGPRFRIRSHVAQEIARLADDLLPRYLFYRYRYDIYPQTQELDDFPPCLQIEPTSICNYRCVFCFQTDTRLTTPANGHMGLMSIDLFRRVIDQAEGRCEAVTLASRGEPLMARDVVAMLSYLAGKFVGVKVNTNAWFLDEAKTHALLQADVNTLVFSVDAADPTLYSRLRVNGKLERVFANVEMFARIRARDYPRSRLITRVSGVRFAPEQDMASMERLWGGLVDQVAFVDYNPWENTYDKPLSGVADACSDLWRRMFVWWDGRVNPCDVDYLSTLSVGSAGATTLSSLWTGEAYERLRAMHTSGRRAQIGPCNRCTLV